jgi:hypothetical protein
MLTLKKWWRDVRRRRLYVAALRRRHQRVDAAVDKEIQRLIHETDGRLSFIANFRKEIEPALRYCMAYINRQMRQIPGPVALSPKHWNDQPLLNAFFVSPQAVSDVLLSSNALKKFFRIEQRVEAIALLTARRRDKMIFGTERNGEIVRRDVPQKVVFFEDLQVICPAEDLKESRENLRHHVLREILELTLNRIDDLQSYKAELKEQQCLLAFKCRDSNASDSMSQENQKVGEKDGSGEARSILAALNQRIEDIENDVDTVKGRLTLFTEVLRNPNAHLKINAVSLKLSRLGIRLDQSSFEEGNEFVTAEFEHEDSTKQAAVWVRVNRSDLRA